MSGLGRNYTILREKLHADVLGRHCGLEKGGRVHLDFAGPPPPNRFLAHSHNWQLMGCHYLLSRLQGEQAACVSWVCSCIRSK